MLLAAQFGDPDAPGVVPSAVVVELTHLGTLYHDDVMDEAALRRGAPSANARWDNSVAILTGTSCSPGRRTSSPTSARTPSASRRGRSSGWSPVRSRETVGPVDGEDAVEHYLSVVADKTGSLIATCGPVRRAAVRRRADVVDVLTRFGERIGVAFQLSDDLLDVASESFQSGKTPGTDLRAIRPMPGCGLLAGGVTDDVEHAEALGLWRPNRGMELARADARRRADDACGAGAAAGHLGPAGPGRAVRPGSVADQPSVPRRGPSVIRACLNGPGSARASLAPLSARMSSRRRLAAAEAGAGAADPSTGRLGAETLTGWRCLQRLRRSASGVRAGGSGSAPGPDRRLAAGSAGGNPIVERYRFRVGERARVRRRGGRAGAGESGRGGGGGVAVAAVPTTRLAGVMPADSGGRGAAVRLGCRAERVRGAGRAPAAGRRCCCTPWLGQLAWVLREALGSAWARGSGSRTRWAARRFGSAGQRRPGRRGGRGYAPRPTRRGRPHPNHGPRMTNGGTGAQAIRL